MIRTVLSFARFVFSLIRYIPFMLNMGRKIKNSPENAHEEEIHGYVSRWALGLVKVSGARPRISGAEHVPADETVLFISNHQSDFDIVMFLAFSPKPIGFVAKIEMLKVPLLRGWMKHIRCVFMDRKDMRQSAKTILEAIDILKSGHSMVLFPEGTRSKSQTPLQFKQGAFKLATKTKVTVVPVTINGSYKIIEENHYKITPADVFMTFHPPVRVAEMDAEALAALPADIEAIIVSAL